jgi:hypothetical protein
MLPSPDRFIRVGGVGLAVLAIGYLVVLASRAMLSPSARAQDSQVVQITLQAQSTGTIDPGIYGVNYVWHLVPASDFPRFATLMHDPVGATLVRYPGGWAAESYDWDTNTYNPTGPEAHSALPDLDGEALANAPGVDPETFLSQFPAASFVTPSAPAIRNPAEIPSVTDTAVRLVHRYGQRVKLWEIGNEWWLQRGAKHDAANRSENLQRYAALVAAAAPAMKAANPNIELYVTGEWTQPDDFATLRKLVGARAWAAVDGLSIHPYCGDSDPDTLCSLLPERVGRIRALTGKDPIFASEWALGTKVTKDDYGIRNANLMVTAFRTLAQARIQSATYWPPVRAVPEIALLSRDYDRAFATGMLFGWMSRYYRGVALATSGPLASAAARSDDGTTIFVATGDSHSRKLEIPLGGTGLDQVVSAEVMFSDQPNDPNRSRFAKIRTLPTRIATGPDGARLVECDLNPGSPGRGAGAEILRITLR